MFCKDEITYNSVPEAHTVLYPSSSWVLLKALSETIYFICRGNDLTIAWQLMTHIKPLYIGYAIIPLQSQSTDNQYKNRYAITCMEVTFRRRYS